MAKMAKNGRKIYEVHFDKTEKQKLLIKVKRKTK